LDAVATALWRRVRYLVEETGADVDRSSKEGRTPLMWACRNGHLDVARLLLAAGADLAAVTKKGVNCLHWAVWGGSIPMARWLMECHGLSTEQLSNAGCNAAIWAAAAGRLDMCMWLRDAGADFELVNYWGHGVVGKAAWKGKLDLLAWLVVSGMLCATMSAADVTATFTRMLFYRTC